MYLADGTAKIFNNTIISHSTEGIIVVSSNSVEISNNTCYNNKIGIGLYDSDNSIIKYNYIHRYFLADDRQGHADRGISVSDSQNVQILNNEIEKTSGGIEIASSNNCLVNGSIIKTTYQYSIGLQSSRNCLIQNSEFRNSIRSGVSIFDSSENNILHSPFKTLFKKLNIK